MATWSIHFFSESGFQQSFGSGCRSCRFRCFGCSNRVFGCFQMFAVVRITFRHFSAVVECRRQLSHFRALSSNFSNFEVATSDVQSCFSLLPGFSPRSESRRPCSPTSGLLRNRCFSKCKKIKVRGSSFSFHCFHFAPNKKIETSKMEGVEQKRCSLQGSDVRTLSGYSPMFRRCSVRFSSIVNPGEQTPNLTRTTLPQARPPLPNTFAPTPLSREPRSGSGRTLLAFRRLKTNISRQVRKRIIASKRWQIGHRVFD